MHPAAGGMHQTRRLGDRLDHPGLVIGMVDGDNGPARPLQGLGQPHQIDHALVVNRQDFDRMTEGQGRLGDTGVFGGTDDQPLATGRQGADQGLTIGLGPARGKDHGGRIHPDQIGHLGPGRLDPGPGATPGGMDGIGVTVVGQGRGHDGLNLGADEAGSIIVQIDRAHAAAPTLSSPALRRRAPVRFSTTSSSDTCARKR